MSFEIISAYFFLGFPLWITFAVALVIILEKKQRDNDVSSGGGE